MNPSPDITWKIDAEPATLSHDEFWARYSHINMPEKTAVHKRRFKVVNEVESPNQ